MEIDKSRFSTSLAANLRAARARAGMSQLELAEAVGMSVSTISQYESGDMMPGSDKLFKLAETLGCTPNELYGWEVA